MTRFACPGIAAASLLLLAGLACGRQDGPVERFIVPSGAPFSQVEDSLDAHGLIGWKPWFRAVAKIGGFERSLKPGVYQFARGTSALAILRDIKAGRYLTVRLTVVEGTTVLDIAAVAARTLQISRDSLLAASRDTALLAGYDIAAPSAEGYLAPETYLVPAHATGRELVSLMLAQFQSGWKDAWDSLLAGRGLTRHEAVTLASIVEGEARVEEERPIIAGVYLNRLRIGMPLQADPTVQYAIQQTTGQRKTRLLYTDYKVKSPYNTYLVRGLPPGPVGAPSQASIQAVLQPAAVPYLYFVAGEGGRHVFSRTYSEHLRAVANSRRLARTGEGGRGR